MNYFRRKFFEWILILVTLLVSLTLSAPVYSDTNLRTSVNGRGPSVESREPLRKNTKELRRGTLVDTETGEVSVRLTVPNTSWRIRIQSIYRMPEELWIISNVSSGGLGASVISEATDTVIVKALPDLPIQHYISGKDWDWKNQEDVRFVGSFDYYQLKLRAWWSGETIEFHRKDSN